MVCVGEVQGAFHVYGLTTLILMCCRHRGAAMQAQEMAKLKNADAVMRRNAESLTDRAGAAAGPPPLWLNMIAPAGLAAAADHVEQRPRSPRGHNADRGDNPVRCSIM